MTEKDGKVDQVFGAEDCDQVSIKRAKTGHPLIVSELIRILVLCLRAGVRLRYTCVIRTPEEQTALYAKGRTAPGRVVTWVEAWFSYHQYGLAVDIVLMKNNKEVTWDHTADLDKDGVADWMEAVKIFKEHGWEWGGDWKTPDRPHFQKTFGLTTKKLNEKRLAGDVDQNGFVKIEA